MKKTLLLIAASIFYLHSFAQVKSSLTDLKNPKNFVWLLKGNTGTDPAVNFIGTRDQQPLVFKVNNQKAGYLDYNSYPGNTAFGYQTLYSISSFADRNTATGYQALYYNTYGSSNTAHGYQALYYNDGSFNTANGTFALYSNITGYSNTANGTSALYSNLDGYSNTAIGTNALNYNTSGGSNTAVGVQALYYNETGNDNVANGSLALNNNTIGSHNIAIGSSSLYSNTTGNNNTANGSLALFYNTGSDNTANGNFALFSNTTGDFNTAFGSGADVSTNTESFTNATAIGYSTLVDASNKVRMGNTSVTSIGGQVGWTTFSDERVKQDVKENVPGLAFIKQLQPVTYHFNISKENELLGKKDSTQWKSKYDIEKIQFTGLIAQEVDAAAQKINYEFSGVDKTGKIWGLRYAEFVVPLVKAVQELSKENDELKARLDKLEALFSQQTSQSVELSDKAMLEQNIPNPANGVTTIRYNVPSYISSAYINVYSSSNTLIRSIKISSKGSGSVDLKISELSSGPYQYTLIVDGKVIDRKQMLITR
jgi:hypothetical protein